jgi:Flp pilus assembly pilin Flp
MMVSGDAEAGLGLIRQLIRDERGQDLAEYAMALAVITAAVALIAASIGTDVQSLWSHAEPKLQTVIDAE